MLVHECSAEHKPRNRNPNACIRISLKAGNGLGNSSGAPFIFSGGSIKKGPPPFLAINFMTFQRSIIVLMVEYFFNMTKNAHVLTLEKDAPL